MIQGVLVVGPMIQAEDFYCREYRREISIGANSIILVPVFNMPGIRIPRASCLSLEGQQRQVQKWSRMERNAVALNVCTNVFWIINITAFDHH